MIDTDDTEAKQAPEATQAREATEAKLASEAREATDKPPQRSGSSLWIDTEPSTHTALSDLQVRICATEQKEILSSLLTNTI